MAEAKTERKNYVQESGKDSGFYTYEWNSLFKKYFKVRKPDAFLKRG